MKLSSLCALFAASILSIPALAATAPSDSLKAANAYPEDIRQAKQIESIKVIQPGGVTAPYDSVYRTIGRFYLNQFRHFQDPSAPYFLFMSKDSHLAMGIGGTIRMRGFYDWNGSIMANGFAPGLIDIPSVPTQKNRINFIPSGTALFFTILGRDTPLGDFQGYIEAGFSGYNGLGFKLKKAYFTLGDWTVGYATSTFVDPSAQPPVIDAQGSNGATSMTSVLARYMHTFSDGHWTIAASVEMPTAQVEDDGVNTKKCSNVAPDVAAFGQYQWDGGHSHVRVSAMTGVIKYRNLLTASNHCVAKWGAQLSALLKVCRPLTIYADAVVGQGSGSYINDLAVGNFDLLPMPGVPGKLYTPTSLGLAFGAQCYILDNLFAGVALGEMRCFNKAGAEGDRYKYGLYGAVNIFWDITSRIEIGAEYVVGKRVNQNGLHAPANRVEALFQFLF